MSFLVIGTERFALEIGENVLGGGATNSVPARALSTLRPFAVIIIRPGMTAMIRALDDSGRLTIGGAVLGDRPRELQHGAHMEIGEVRITYGELALLERTSPAVRSVSDHEWKRRTFAAVQQNEPTADTGGRVIHLHTHARYEVPAEGLRIGRDPGCHIVLASRAVSREHAVIAPSLLGYMLTDRSTNGVFINGERIQGSQLLCQGDWFRVGDVEFRFEADPTASEQELEANHMPAVHATKRPNRTRAASARTGSVAEPPTAELPPPKKMLASIEVLNEGPMKGMRFRIERSLVQIGRGPHNDVRIPDESVSSSHATLTAVGTHWHLIDLDSKNGTYVGGNRVANDTVLSGAAELRFGVIKVLFRPVTTGTEERKTTPRAVR